GPRGAGVRAARAAARGHLRERRPAGRWARSGPKRAAHRGRTARFGRCAMSFSLRKSMIIARREYLTTVRRKAFVVSLLLTPAILCRSGSLSNKLANDDARKRYAEARIVALVDSSGLYRDVGAAYMYQPQPDAPTDPRQAMKPVVMPPPIPVILRRYDSQ